MNKFSLKFSQLQRKFLLENILKIENFILFNYFNL